MARLSVSREAKRDLVEIFVYIARDSLDAARRINFRLKDSLAVIAGQPEIGRKRDELIPGIRSLASGNYVVYYCNVDGGVRVLRILHGSRDIQQLFE